MNTHCPMCGMHIINGKEHLRSVAELKNGTYICNNGACIGKAGGWEAVKAYSGLTTKS